MYLDDNMRKEIEERVVRLANEYSIDLNSPIDIVTFAGLLGFTVLQQDMPSDLCGFVMVNKNENIECFDTNKLIVVNDSHPANRKRFTIAHELGHYIFDYLDKGEASDLYAHREDGNCNTLDERKANYFAAAILMPESRIAKVYESYRKFGAGVNTFIPKMASDFRVSPSSMAIRLSELGLK